MELSGVSGSSSYDQLQQLQLEKDKDKKAAIHRQKVMK